MIPIAPDLVRDFVIAAHFNLEKVQTLLADQPALLTAQHPWGEQDFEDGLGAAAHVGNRAIAEFLLAQGAPLHICVAAMLGQRDTVRELLANDPTLANARGAHGISLMFHAAMSGDTALAQLLKDHGCHEGYSHALFGALSQQRAAMVRWLLANGADDLTQRDFEGKTLVQRALATGQPDLADLLRQHGAPE